MTNRHIIELSTEQLVLLAAALDRAATRKPKPASKRERRQWRRWEKLLWQLSQSEAGDSLLFNSEGITLAELREAFAIPEDDEPKGGLH